jgi:polyisoprenoid-binding protein YceI
MKRLVLILFCLSAVAAAPADQGPCVVPGRGHFQIHTDTSGLFGAFGHEHLIQAKTIQGCAVIDKTNLAKSSIKLTFPTKEIRVVDTKVDAKERAKVQEAMETEVLDVSKYPQVVFESTSVEGNAGASTSTLRIHGNLTIHGKTQQIIVPVNLARLDDGTYRASGAYSFKQTSFGIRPIKLAGGTVKVKDEVRTEFELYLK